MGVVEWAEINPLKAKASSMKKPSKRTQKCPFKVGDKRVFTFNRMFYSGRIVEIHSDYIVIDHAAWIADTGTFSKRIKTGDFWEVEPFPVESKVTLTRSNIVTSVEVPKLTTVRIANGKPSNGKWDPSMC